MRNLNKIEIRTLSDYNSLGTKNLLLVNLVQEHQRILELLFREYCTSKYGCAEDTIQKIIDNCLSKDPQYIKGRYPDGKPIFHNHFKNFKNKFFYINTTLRNIIQHEGYIPTENEADTSSQYFKGCLQYYFTHCVPIQDLSPDEQKAIEHLFINDSNIPDKKGSKISEQKQQSQRIPEEKSNAAFKKDTDIDEQKGKVKPLANHTIRLLYGGLIIISLALVFYLLLKSNEKPQKGDPQITIVPENPKDSAMPEPPNDTPGTKIATIIQPKENETGFVKKEERGLEPKADAIQNDTPKYILNDEFKNKVGTNEMAVLIINSNNSTNGAISQKIASAFLKNIGYNNTASLISKQFVTDGLFEKIFNGEKFDFSKQKFGDFADYFCLGKLNIEIGQSDVRNDMTKATISLEIKVVKTTNGEEIINLTIPIPYSVGAGYSKQEAIEVATNNIITYLKNYKYENQ